MSKFFIDHPVFAWVVAILISLGGVISIFGLGVESYPDIAPPQVTVNATYPGASADTAEKAGHPGDRAAAHRHRPPLYFSSSSSSSGGVSITLTFETGTDADIAQVQVQNKVSLATPRLPSEVTQQGVVVAKANAGFLMVVALRSSNRPSTATRCNDLIGSTRAGSDLARARRRQHPAVRQRIRHEHLAQSRPAAGLRPVRQPGAGRGARPERAVRGRLGRRAAAAGRARASPPRCRPKAASARPSSSATSCCAPTATAPRCG